MAELAVVAGCVLGEIMRQVPPDTISPHSLCSAGAMLVGRGEE